MDFRQRPTNKHTIEYAGFMYWVDPETGYAYAESGQHPAASKQKHRMVAAKIYKELHSD